MVEFTCGTERKGGGEGDRVIWLCCVTRHCEEGRGCVVGWTRGGGVGGGL